MKTIESLILALSCLLLGSSAEATDKPQAFHKASASVAGSSYVEEIKRLYQQAGNGQTNPQDQLSRMQDHFDSNFFMQAQGGENKAKRSELEKKLAELEKSEGSNNISLVPVLMQLYILQTADSSNSNSNKLFERGIDIAESYYGSGKCSAQDAYSLIQALSLRSNARFMMSFRRIGGPAQESNGTDLQERAQRLVYKLQLKAQGIRAISSLPSLCQYLQAKGKSEEALALYKVSIDYLEKRTAPEREQLMLLSQYMNALQQAGKSGEANTIKQKLEAIQAKEYDRAAAAGEEALASARKRAEIDPVGLVDSLLRMSQLRLAQKKKTEALALFNEALTAYSNIPAEDDVSNATESLWRNTESYLRSAETKADENIIYTVVDASEKRQYKGRGHGRRRPRTDLYEIVRHFTDLHRTGDAIKFLQYVLDTKRKLHPDDIDGLQDVSRQLQSLYMETDDYEKAEAMILEQLKSAEKAEDQKAILDALLDSAELYNSEQKDKERQSSVARALAIAMSMTNVETSDANRLASTLVADGQLKEADGFIRHLCESINSEQTGLFSFISNDISQLISSYAKKSMFAEAESLLDFVKKKDSDRNEDSWCNNESELFLQHAKALKNEGKTAAAQNYLAKSNEAFVKILASRQGGRVNPGTQDYLERLKQQRQATLKQYGFGSE